MGRRWRKSKATSRLAPSAVLTSFVWAAGRIWNRGLRTMFEEECLSCTEFASMPQVVDAVLRYVSEKGRGHWPVGWSP
jgi:hypothetical protein